MPTYAYRCDNCGVQFDRFQGFSEPTLVRCPECGEDALRKLYTPVGIVFKGSGFYATDHRSPSGQAPTKKTDSPSTGDKASGDKSTSGKAAGEKTPSGGSSTSE